MTEQKKKAEELIDKFLQYVDCGDNRYSTKTPLENAKQCAILCVDEILKTCPQKENEIFGISKGIEFWQQVKQEIINYRDWLYGYR